MKVNFLIIGAAKSATTSLCNALSQHPDISFCQPKEPQFFSKPNWRESIKQYHALFKKKAELYGEGSTNYTKYPSFNKNIHDDIYEYNSEMKLIYIMRQPVDRIVSQYIHAYNRGYESSKDINSVIRSNLHYIHVSKYAFQIEPYIERFGRHQVLLLFFEDFINNSEGVLDTVFQFLNIEKITIDSALLDTNKSFNRRVLHYKYDNPKTRFDKLKKVGLIIKNYFNSDFIDTKPQLTEDSIAFIVDQVKEDILKIEKLTNRDLSHWLKC